MSNTSNQLAPQTQLPAEIVQEIEQNAKLKLIRNGNTSFSRGYYSGEVSGATAYAIKAYQAQQEMEELKRWKEEAKQLLNPILDYGQSKEANIPLGESITNMVLERCKRLDKAQQMLFRLASLVNADQKPDEKFLTEIKTFLDGK